VNDFELKSRKFKCLAHLLFRKPLFLYKIFEVFMIAQDCENLYASQHIMPFFQITNNSYKAGLQLNVTKSVHDGFLNLFDTYLLQAVSTTPEAQITASRMIPRSLMEDESTASAVVDAMRVASDQGFINSCVTFNGTKKAIADSQANAVFPLWREALMHCIFVQTWNFSAPWGDMVARQDVLTNIVMPKVEAATPGGGAYLNEANFEQEHWQEVFYGESYGRLSEIKRALDPDGILYAGTAVDSDELVQDGQGRLCRA
jgi:hypothetical protein